MTGQLELGMIICTHCGEIIDTLDTEKVVTYYGACGKEECAENGSANSEDCI